MESKTEQSQIDQTFYFCDRCEIVFMVWDEEGMLEMIKRGIAAQEKESVF